MNTPMNYGLTPRVIEAITSVLCQYPQVEKVLLYGSRAMGNYRYNSDIDLVLIGSLLDSSTLFKIENELDDLLLPYTIDLALYHSITNPALLDHINRRGLVFYTAAQAVNP